MKDYTVLAKGEIAEYILRSVLGPQATNKGIVKNLDDLAEVEYQIPKGMTQEQAMLVVLGAMMSPQAMKHAHCGSSSDGEPLLMWKQKYLYRDYLTGDDRAHNFDKAMLEGRKLAAEAFKAYEDGDDSKVNEMLTLASSVIKRDAVLAVNMGRDTDQGSIAAMKLMIKAQGNSSFDKLMDIGSEELNLIKSKIAHSQLYDEMKYYDELLQKEYKTATTERKRELLNEYGWRKAVSDAYIDGIKKLYDSFEDYGIDSELPKDDTGIAKKSASNTPEYLNLKKKAYTAYLDMHPMVLAEKLNSPEGLAELKAKATEDFAKSEDYVAFMAGDDTKLTAIRMDKKAGKYVSVEDDTPENLRRDREKKWKATDEAIKKDMRALLPGMNDCDNVVMKQISEEAEKKNAGKFTIIAEEYNKNVFEEGSIGSYVRMQEPIYILNEGADTIYSMVTQDGKKYTVEAMTDMPEGLTLNSIKRFRIVDAAVTIKRYINNIRSINRTFDRFSETEDDKTMKGYIETCEKSLVEILKNPKTESLVTLKELSDNIINLSEKTDKNRNYHLYRGIGNFAKVTIDNAEKQIAEQSANYKTESVELEPSLVYKEMQSRDNETERSIGAYIDRLKKFEEIPSEVKDEYVDFIVSLGMLNSYTDRLYAKDKNGGYLPSTKENIDNLMRYTLEAINKTDKIIEKLPADGAFALKNIANNVSGLLRKDVATLTKTEFRDGMSLPELLDTGRVLRVDFTGKNPDTVGEKSNKRYAIEIVNNGEKIKGFFTNEKKLEYGENIRQALEPLRNKYNEYEGYPKLIDEIERAIIDGKNAGIEENIIIQTMKRMGLQANYEFCEACDKALSNLKKVDNQYKGNGAIRAEINTSITGRNTATSRVANLLGMPGIVARSENMEMLRDGVITKGVFMANAEGTSFDNVIDRASGHFGNDYMDNPEFFKDAARLQLLDYICQNIDRHQDNMFYKLNEDKTKIIGLQGIDNDLSFGVQKDADDVRFAETGTAFDDLNVISEDVAERIMLLDGETIKASLRDCGMTTNEINAAAERFSKIKNAVEENKIRVVRDDEWDDIHLESFLGQKRENFISTLHKSFELKRKPQISESNAEDSIEKSKEISKKEIKFTEIKSTDGADEISFMADVNKLDAFLERMNRSQKEIWGGSDEFVQLIGSVKSMKAQLQGMPKEPVSRDYLMLQAKFEAIGDKAKAYLKIKEGQKGLKSKTQRRVDIAKELEVFSRKRGGEYVEAMHRKDELETAKLNVEIKKQANLISEASGIFNTLVEIQTQYSSNGYRTSEVNQVGELMLMSSDAVAGIGYIINGSNGKTVENSRDTLPKTIALLVSQEMVLEEREKNNPGYTVDPAYTNKAENKKLKAGEVELLIDKAGAAKFVEALAQTKTIKEFSNKTTVTELRELLVNHKTRDLVKTVKSELLGLNQPGRNIPQPVKVSNMEGPGRNK